MSPLPSADEMAARRVALKQRGAAQLAALDLADPALQTRQEARAREVLSENRSNRSRLRVAVELVNEFASVADMGLAIAALTKFIERFKP